MAIIKKLESSFGVDLNYHRITNISLNALDKEVIICVGSYLDKEKRDKGCDPIDSIDILVPKEDYQNFFTGNVLEVGYKWLRENVVGFEEAIDDK